jgi:hypothetical protein
MTSDAAQSRKQLLDELASEPEYFYAGWYAARTKRYEFEQPPFPPPHLVTLARVVHLLAKRAIARRHPSLPDGLGAQRDWPASFHLYVAAVLNLNAAINQAAKACQLRLFDRTSGVRLPDWHLPSNDGLESWIRIHHSGEPDSHRRAIDFIMSSAVWIGGAYPHFTDAIAVSPEDFADWAENECIASPGEVAAGLNSMRTDATRRRGVIRGGGAVQSIAAMCGVEMDFLADAAPESEAQQKPAGSPAPRVYWLKVLYREWSAIETAHPEHGKRIPAIRHLKKLGDPRIPNIGASEELYWIPENASSPKLVPKTTLSTAISKLKNARKSSS